MTKSDLVDILNAVVKALTDSHSSGTVEDEGITVQDDTPIPEDDRYVEVEEQQSKEEGVLEEADAVKAEPAPVPTPIQPQQTGMFSTPGISDEMKAVLAERDREITRLNDMLSKMNVQSELGEKLNFTPIKL